MAEAYINVEVTLLAQFAALLPASVRIKGSAESSEYRPGVVSFVLEGEALEPDALYRVHVTETPLARTVEMVKIGEVT